MAIRNAEGRSLLRRLKAFIPSALSWSRNGDFLAATNSNWDCQNIVSVVRVADRKQIASLELPKFSTDPQFWGDSEELIFSANAGIWTWNPHSNKTIKRAKIVDNIWHIGWSEDGKNYVYRKGKTTAFLDSNDWKSHKLDVPEKAEHFTLSPDGKQLAMTVGNTIVIWDLLNNERRLKWQRPNYGQAISVDFSPDGQQLACTPGEKG